MVIRGNAGELIKSKSNAIWGTRLVRILQNKIINRNVCTAPLPLSKTPDIKKISGEK